MTAEQIEQKKQLLAEKVKQMNALTKELVEAGAIALGSPLATEGTQELSEDDLDKAAGGWGLSQNDPDVVIQKHPIDPGKVMPKEKNQPSVKL